jgi:GGDEF domain-containing protein
VLLVDLPGTRGLGAQRGRVLNEAAGVLLNECRDIDVLGRHDDTSFLCLLPQTGMAGTRVLAERILARLEESVRSSRPIDAAVAIVTVPRAGIERKDDLLDLLRLTLVSAWAGQGAGRVVVAS